MVSNRLKVSSTVLGFITSAKGAHIMFSPIQRKKELKFTHMNQSTKTIFEVFLSSQTMQLSLIPWQLETRAVEFMALLNVPCSRAPNLCLLE